MKEVCTLFGAKQVQTTAYHPQANGATERFNQTLANSLSHYVQESQKDWDQWIPYVVFAYNTTPHTSTGETPFFLMYGRDPEVPMEDILVPRKISYFLDDKYEEEVHLRLKLAHQEAQTQLEKSFQQMKIAHDKGTKLPTFKVGDTVYLKVGNVKVGVGRKLAPKWNGPYIITRQTGFVNYEFKTKKGKLLKAQACRLKKGESRDAEKSSPSTSPQLYVPAHLNGDAQIVNVDTPTGNNLNFDKKRDLHGIPPADSTSRYNLRSRKVV